MELVGGSIIIMSPSGYEPEEVGTQFAALLRNWVRPRKLGTVVGSKVLNYLILICVRSMLLLYVLIDLSNQQKIMQN
jgi:hypothetical protein